MHRIYCCIALLLLTLPLAAIAYEPDAVMLKDYMGLTKALRANGVEPARVDWLPIESMCLGLKTEKNQVSYNQCRFTTIINQALFGDDRQSCDEESDVLYPNGMLRGVITASREPVPMNELLVLRRASYTSCMRALGWKNTRNWQMGRVGE